MRKPDVIENLLVAQAMVLDLPNSAIDLYSFANNAHMDSDGHDCGSVGCFGGWVAVHPHFIKQGIRRHLSGAPVLASRPHDIFATSEFLFGDDDMFDQRRDGSVSQKREILDRIKRALAQAVAA